MLDLTFSKKDILHESKYSVELLWQIFLKQLES